MPGLEDLDMSRPAAANSRLTMCLSRTESGRSQGRPDVSARKDRLSGAERIVPCDDKDGDSAP
jgi:hypothetical protein